MLRLAPAFVFSLLMALPVWAEETPSSPPATRSAAPAVAIDKPAEKAAEKTAEKSAPTPAEAAATKPPSGKASYREIAKRVAKEKGIPFELVDAVMWVESNYNPRVRGGDGEVGLMQLMPPTAKQLGFSGTLDDLADPETNIRLGAVYLKEAWRLARKDICTTVMKYRAGWGETRFSVLSVRYCVRVRQHLASLGYEVQGSVPEPTFGFKKDEFHQGVQLGSIAARKRLASGRKLKSRVDWGAYDRRMKALDQGRRVGLGL
jgi:soluble lytic murein transglycosylase-like protein